MRAFLLSGWFKALLVLGLLAGAFGVWVLLHPGSFVVQPWRAQETKISSRYIFGPYPLEEDFARLKQRGVTTIISLLNPDVPYENVLLAQEREHAERLGIKVLNFPMGSILGQKFGEDYEKNSRAAAAAAIGNEGVAYIHCYLGLHRAKNVRQYLGDHIDVASYEGGVQHNRTPDQLALERSRNAWRKGEYPRALSELDNIETPGSSAHMQRGWTYLRMGRNAQARESFERSIRMDPGNIDAHTGQGFAALRLDDLATAEREFSWVIDRDHDHHDATEGLAYVYYRQGLGDKARPLLERVLAKAPTNEDARRMLDKLTAAETP